MSNPIWIAIAAIIVPFITSWSQFLLKERSEKKRALAAANPATNQPKALMREDKTVISEIRRHPLMFVTQWLATTVIAQILIAFRYGQIQIGVTTICLFAYALALAILLYIIAWRQK
jgi:hypothetical protein